MGKLYEWGLVALIALGAVAGLMGAGYGLAAHSYKARIVALNATHGEELSRLRGDLEAARATAEKQARDEEQRRANEIAKVSDEAQSNIDAARADARAAAGLVDGLRKQARSLALACGASASSAGATRTGEAASSPGLVLADVFGRADARAGELAAAYDEARAAGAACERAYTAVRGR